MENGFKEEKDALALIEELNGKQAKVKSIVKNIAKKRKFALTCMFAIEKRFILFFITLISIYLLV